MATANLEYQSLNAAWLIHYRVLASLLTHITVFWELSYCALVWPRLTRPIVIAIAFGIHLGIGMFLGMWTFGLVMCFANMAFISPWVVRRIIDRSSTADSRAQIASNVLSANGNRSAVRTQRQAV